MVILNNLILIRFVDADMRFCFKEIWQQEVVHHHHHLPPPSPPPLPTPNTHTHTVVHVVLHIEAMQLMKWALLNVYMFM